MGLIIKNKEIGNARPLICVPVMEKTKDTILEEFAYLAKSDADIIEWRVDAFENFTDIYAVLEVLNKALPLINEKIFLYTFRTKQQGGEAEPEKELLHSLHSIAAESGTADLIDLEFFAEEHPARKVKSLQKNGAKIIASHHDFELTPPAEVMKMLLEKMAAGGADIVKLAVMPKNRKDVLNVLEVTNEFRKSHPDIPVITMSMGSMGSISRLCGETFGSCVTFGCHNRASAPGQFEMSHLAEVLNIIHESINKI